MQGQPGACTPCWGHRGNSTSRSIMLALFKLIKSIHLKCSLTLPLPARSMTEAPYSASIFYLDLPLLP